VIRTVIDVSKTIFWFADTHTYTHRRADEAVPAFTSVAGNKSQIKTLKTPAKEQDTVLDAT